MSGSKRDIAFNLNGDKILFSELSKVINRAADTTVQVHNRTKRRAEPELKLIMSLRKKIGQNTENSTIYMSRAEVRLLQGLLLNISATLYTSVIPNYRNRIEKEPETAKDYQPYIEKCENRIMSYKKILEIIQSLL